MAGRRVRISPRLPLGHRRRRTSGQNELGFTMPWVFGVPSRLRDRHRICAGNSGSWQPASVMRIIARMNPNAL